LIPSVKPTYNKKNLDSVIIQAKKGVLNEETVKEFETKFAKKVNSKFGICFPYARAGLYAFLISQKIEKSNIILPAYQCLVVPNAILQSNNNTIFVDNAKGEVNMDINKLTKIVNEKTKAVVVTHMHGYSTDIFRIKDELPEDIFIIEDSCLAIHSTFKNKPTGNQGDISFYSFNDTKQFTTNDGGIVVTDNEEIAEKLIETRNHLFNSISTLKSIKKFRKTSLTNKVYEHDRLFNLVYFMWEHFDFVKKFTKPADINETSQPSDFLLNFSPIKAYLGLLQLDNLEHWIKRRKEIGKRYYETIEKLEILNFEKYDEGATYGHFPVWSKERLKIKFELKKKGIATGHSFDYSCPYTPAYQSICEGKDYPESKKISEGVFDLPMYNNLSDENMEFICDSIENICKSK